MGLPSMLMVPRLRFARPDSDVATGGWTVTPLWSKLDEVTADDLDEAVSTSLTDAAPSDTFTVGLLDLADPGVNTGHVIRARLKWDSLAVAGTLSVELMQGGTVVATLSTGGDTVYALYAYTLTAAEAANITNYADLRLRVTATKDGVGGTLVGSCSWLEFEVP